MKIITFLLMIPFQPFNLLGQIYTPGANVESVTNGTNNIGIGVGTPVNPLQVEGSVTELNILLKNTGLNGARTYLTSFPGKSSIQTDKDFTIRTNYANSWTDKFILTNVGNVGIGINQPAHPLDVNGTIRSSSYFRTTNVSMGHGYIADDGAGSTIFSITRQLNNETRFHSNGFHSFYSGGNTGVERMRIDANGNVGIGTNLPGSKLAIISGGQSVKFLTGTNTSSYTLEMGVNDNGVNISNNSAIRGFNFTNATGNLFTIASNGNVGIGTGANSPDARLAVKGHIHTQEVRVDLTGSVAPDYVFASDYNLLPLPELETYIKTNKHLPEIPSSKEMEENGLNLKEMNLLLLKKVEELTLYVLEQNQKLDQQMKVNNEHAIQIEILTNSIHELNKN